MDTLPTSGQIAAAIENKVVAVSAATEDSGVVTIDTSALETEGKLTITGAKAGTETVTLTASLYKVNYADMSVATDNPTEYEFVLNATVSATPEQPAPSGGSGGGGGCSAGFGALALFAAVPLLFRKKK